MTIDLILQYAPIIILAIAQIIMLIKGNTKSAEKIAQEKEKYINKLIAKRDKEITKAESLNTKIEKEKNTNVTNS